MLALPADPDLEYRLTLIARRLGKTPDECLRIALAHWIEVHEETHAAARNLSGGNGMVRLPDEFYD